MSYNAKDNEQTRQAEQMMFKLIEDKSDGFSTNDIVQRLREAKCPPPLIKRLAQSLILQYKGAGYIVQKKPAEYILSDHNRSLVRVWKKR
jgi:hypothetical protein